MLCATVFLIVVTVSKLLDSGQNNTCMDLDTAATTKKVRERISTYLSGRPFEVDRLQVETIGTEESDEVTRVRVWLEESDSVDELPERYTATSSSAEWEALTELVQDVKTDSELPDEVGAGTVSANRSHMQVVFPASEYEIGKFYR